MFLLSDFLDDVVQDGQFLQTQFSGSPQPHSICFAKNERYFSQACENPAISAIITMHELAELNSSQKAVARTSDPEMAFYRLHNRLAEQFDMRPQLEPKIDPSADIHPTAIIDPYCEIAAGVVIQQGAIVLNGSVLSRDVLVGPGAIVGASGHFYKRSETDLFEVAHAGGVYLHEGSRVLAGAIVSKAVHTDFTTIGAKSVVGVQCHVAHGCEIGPRTIIAGSSQISGYTSIGADCWIGPSCTIGNLLKIGDKVSVEAGSVVVEKLKDGARVSGNYAVAHSVNMMDYARKRRKTL